MRGSLLKGELQAEKLADFLADRDVKHIVSSPYERAYRTVAPFANRHGIDAVLDDRLAERVLSGESHPDWRERLMRTYDDLDLCYEGGESSRTAMRRAVQVVEEVANRGNANAVIVSHGNLISLLLKYYDDRIGFSEWEKLTNPDVYQLIFASDKPIIRRVWTDF